MKAEYICALLPIVAACLPCGMAEEIHTFTRIQLNDQFWCEGANFGDLNNDGVNDVISGPWSEFRNAA
jgi:hypothetical protein